MRLPNLLPMLVLAVALLIGAGVSPAEARKSDLELTWHKGYMALPDAAGGGISFLSDEGRLDRLAATGRKFPVVIYMHGCTGLGDVDRALMRRIAKAGYVVVAPNSMARSWRPPQCDSWNKRGYDNYFVFDFRQAEINYAARMMFTLPWADTDYLFLAGTSEGGLATAHYRGDVFKARVITQWTCHGSSWVRGISGPEDTPILAVVRRNDPWNADNPEQRGDCGAYFGDRRPGSESIVLEEGSRHEVIGDEAVIERIVSFLLGFTRFKPPPPPPAPKPDWNAMPLR